MSDAGGETGLRRPLQQRIEAAIAESTGQAARLAHSRAARGGCIHDSRIVTLRDGRRFFVKTHAAAATMPGLFAGEYEVLSRLAGAAVIDVPRPVASADDFIVLEVFNAGQPAPDWQEQIGHRLAQLHQTTRADRFGFDRDTWLGTSRQDNRWRADWPGFWREQRLGPQLALLAGKIDSADPLLKSGHKLMSALDELLGGMDEPPVLIHGDLWRGNAAANEKGEPVIFDPAGYYASREAEFGMMRLFGGFGPRAEAAYAEVWPLPPGAEPRIALYRLYHELNHLNLFGRAYYQGCLATLNSLL